MRDPELIERAVGAFHEQFAGHVSRTGGVVEDLRGGTARACFGGDATDDHLDRAIAAALLLREESSAGRLRMGIASGEVVRRAPTPGSNGSTRDQPPVSTGLPVAVAEALAHDAAPRCVLVEQNALAAARSRYTLGPEQHLESWQLTAVSIRGRSASAAERAVAGLHRGFLGRDMELAALLEDYRTCVRQGEGRRVTILGDPGIGKSALLTAFRRRVSDEEPSPLLLSGQCIAYGQGSRTAPSPRCYARSSVCRRRSPSPRR